MTETYNWADRRTRRQQPPAVVVQPVIIASGSGDAYGQAALAREVSQLLDTTEGGRNDQLNRAAFSLGQLVASGHLAQGDVDEQLRSAALRIGLSPGEVEATLASGRRAGTALPRDVSERPSAVTEVSVLQLVPGDAQQPAQEQQDAGESESESEGVRARTSWWPQPLAERAAASAEEPAPTHLVRDDGQPLLYSGKVNGLIGESESGKSWVALLAVVQAVAAGQRVLYLDFEDSAGSINRRLASLGVIDHQGLVDYADPDEALHALGAEDLSEAVADGYALIVADGVNAAMTLLGYDLNSNTDANLFTAKLLRPLARTGACVVTVDHVPKNPEARGKGGIGAQSKRAMMDGCCLAVEIVEPFGKGQSGELKLTVDKDRNGHVRGTSSGGRYAGKVHLDSVGDQVRMHIAGPDLRPADEKPTWRPTGLMEKVSRALEHMNGAPSFRAIKDVVTGRETTIKEALAALVEDGYVRLEGGSRGAVLHHFVKPYRESEDGQNTLSPTVSHRLPETVKRVSPVPPPPYGEGDTHAETLETQPSPAESGDTQRPLDMPTGQSSCNRCGDPVDDATLEETAGYCRPCGRVMNP